MAHIRGIGERDRGWLRRREAGISTVPWFDLGVLYGILAILIAADFVVVTVNGFQIVPGALWSDSGYAVLIALVGGAYAVTGRSPSLAALLFVIAALVLGGLATLVLLFAATAMGYSMVDRALAGLDDMLGLDWVGYERWFSGHPLLSSTTGFLYQGSTLVLLIALFVLAWTGRLHEMLRLAIAAALTLIVTVTIGGFLPAEGPHRFYHVPDGGKAYWVDALIRIVTERPHLIVLNSQPPLTTFPSYHATLAVLVTLACWRIPRFGPLFALFNLFWSLSIPVWGSHYFVDMIAGAAIAAAGYGFAGAIIRPGERRQTRSLAATGKDSGRASGGDDAGRPMEG